jgi:succinate dehydrogenase flavin-adding protein (antitoxin of CptAB toxin-antitoxin module)
MEQTFEDFLISTFTEEEPESAGNKDTFQDNYERWLEKTDIDLLIAYAEKWHLTRMLAHTVEMYASTNSK